MAVLPLLVLSTLLHALIGWRLLPSLGAWPWMQILLAVLLPASAVLMPLGLMVRRGLASPMRRALNWSGMVLMGFFSSLLVLTLARDLLLLLVMPFGFEQWPAWAADSALAVPLLSLAATVWGYFNARRRASVVVVDIPIADLPDALHGFRIAQISDIHVGPTIRGPYLQAIVSAVNALQVDMVAVTGDLVDGSVQELARHVEPLGTLSSRHGTFFVTGNHEYYSGAHAWIDELRRLGVCVLMNEHVVLEHDEASLVVAGVADYSAHHFDPSHRSDPQAALLGAPPSLIRVLLAHQPRSAHAAEQAGFHLQLSGHTHGGQFLPWNFLVRLQQPFTAGLNRLHKLWVYTSRGTGYWGPPKRLGAPSEITHLRMVRAPA